MAVFVNCMAWLPFSLLQSAGRADLTGKLHIVEIPLYVAITAFLIRAAGVEGAAVGALLRAAIDAGAVVWMTRKVLGSEGRVARRYWTVVGLGIATMVVAAAPVSLGARLMCSLMSLLGVGAAMWRFLLDATDREAIISRAGTIWARLRDSAT
jgi:hypothetical protein